MFQSDVLKQVTRGFDPGTKVHTVVTAFAETMLEPMIMRYSLYPAKGTTDPRYAHNPDQTMFTHVCNGLFPTLNVIYEGQKRKLDRLSRLTEEEIKVYMLGYVTHDLDKILGEQLRTLTTRGTIDACAKLRLELEKLNTSAFLPELKDWLVEILWLAVNTQRSYGINLSHNTFINDEVVKAIGAETRHFRTGIGTTLRDLCTYSDLIAYFIKSPDDALLSNSADRIQQLLRTLTDSGSSSNRNHFRLAYHKLTEVRGFLSNQINNAVIAYMQGLYPQDEEPLIPYLYFPNGVVYLDPLVRAAPMINDGDVQEAVKKEIQNVCDGLIGEDGFSFNHLGRLDYPSYFHDFLSPEAFLESFAKRAWQLGGETASGSALTKMRQIQADGLIPPEVDLDYIPSTSITILGRFLINYVYLLEKIFGKTEPQIRDELERRLKARLGEDIWNRSKLIPSSGGVDYRFYWLAARYLDQHPLALTEGERPGRSLQGLFLRLVQEIIELAGEKLTTVPDFQGPYMKDLMSYLTKNLTFGFKDTSAATRNTLPNFTEEMERYAAAKKPRGSQLICTICNSEYPIEEQKESSVQFQPWVYKNALPLYKSKNAGGICSICSLELMLRQLLLTDHPEQTERTRVVGKGFEDMELKYFFLYPGFFFTNQTYALVSWIIRKMQNLKLYELCEVLREKEKISTSDLLNLRCFNLSSADYRALVRRQKEQQNEQQEKNSMYLFDRYEKKQYAGFIFFAKKTFKPKKKGDSNSAKATTASWIEAVWLGLALPLITGSRVVVTEMYLPLYNSAADFFETVVLDAPHQSVRHLLLSPTARLKLDQLYGKRDVEGDYIGGLMAAFSRAIEIHIDTEHDGGDLRLERFTHIARNLKTDQMYVFTFLKEQLRRDKIDSIPAEKAHHYNAIYHQFVRYYHSNNQGGCIVSKIATRHEKIVDLYLKFYSPFPKEKKGWPSAHAITRPIDIAAKTIINKSSLAMDNDEEIKLQMVADLETWLKIVERGGATGSTLKSGWKREDLVRAFVDAFYEDIFRGLAEGQRSLLNSRLNQIRHACETAFSTIIRKRSKSDSEQAQAAVEAFEDDSEPEEEVIVHGE